MRIVQFSLDGCYGCFQCCLVCYSFTESGFIKRVDKGQVNTVRQRFGKLKVRALALRQSEIHPNKGLTLYTSAFEPFRVLIKSLSNRLIKLNVSPSDRRSCTVSLEPRILLSLLNWRPDSSRTNSMAYETQTKILIEKWYSIFCSLFW